MRRSYIKESIESKEVKSKNIEIIIKKIRTRKEGNTIIYSITIPKRWIKEWMINLEGPLEVKLVFDKDEKTIMLMSVER